MPHRLTFKDRDSAVLKCAAAAHREFWSAGKGVSSQTRKAQNVCRKWQEAVKKKFPEQFDSEYSICVGESKPSQKINLVNRESRTAYELKASPNNVHMEIYRDVFKVLVYNRRVKKEQRMTKLMFIAPQKGIKKLGSPFLRDVKAIVLKLKLKLEVRCLK